MRKLLSWLWPPARRRALALKGWVHVAVPREVATQVGRTSLKEGVVLSQAVGAACLLFSCLSDAEKHAAVMSYLEHSCSTTPTGP